MREQPRERPQDPEIRERALEGDGKWGHDAYRGPVGGARGGARRGGPPGPRDPTSLGTKL